MTALKLSGLTKRFGAFVALHPLDLALNRGERMALIGANGAGKSTVLKLVGGQMSPSAGDITLEGQSLTACTPEARARKGLGVGFQRSSCFAGLSVDDNLLCARLAQQAHPYSLWRRRRDGLRMEENARQAHEQLLARMGLLDKRHQSAGTLAYGDQRFLEVAMAVASRPRVLVLDEPCAGLNPAETMRMLRCLQDLPTECSLLMVEHDLQVVFALAQRIAVLDQGHLLACDTPEQIAHNQEVRAAYLGSAKGFNKVSRPSGARVSSSGVNGLSSEPGCVPLVQARRVQAGYGGAPILQGLDLRIAPGEAWALLGRNGSGRSTLAKVLTGQLPYRGHLQWQGRSIADQAPHQLARSGLAYVPESRDVFTTLTVQQNLELGLPRPPSPPAKHRVDGPWNLQTVYDLFPQLKARRDTLGGALSGGEQQMLSLARSLLGNPHMLLVDEPTEGLSPQMVARVHVCLAQVKATGCALLLIEQKVDLAVALADQIVVLGNGQVQWTGPSDQLAHVPEVVEKWLSPANDDGQGGRVGLLSRP